MTVEDEAEIRNLLARVLHMTDGRGDMAEYVYLYTEDCVWESEVAGTFHGREGQLARHAKYRGAGIQGPDVNSYHVLTTVEVHVDGATATSMSTWMLVFDTAGSPPVLQAIGTYTDTLRHEDGMWRLHIRRVGQGNGDWLAEREAAAKAKAEAAGS